MIKSIDKAKVKNLRVFVREGFDVPLKANIHTEQQEVADDERIKAGLPTLLYLAKNGARIIIGTHIDRPQGKWDEEHSVWPVAVKLGELMNRRIVRVTNVLPKHPAAQVFFLDQNITAHDFSDLSESLKPGDIMLLENLRFYPGEEKNDEKFTKTLASYADIYVNDAFSVSHRDEASITGLPSLLPAYASAALVDELKALDRVIKSPKQPLVVVMGGAKISGKVETIRFLAEKAEKVLIGGALANAFLKARGYEVGKSQVSDVGVAKDLLRNFGTKIVLPKDMVVSRDLDSEHPRLVTVDKVRPEETIFDIGPQSVRMFAEYIKEAKTVVWNGPLGFIEKEKFAFGSKSIARTIASVTKRKAYGVVGGGETIEALNMAKMAEFIDHVSMGGGAMLEYLSGKKLPGISALENNIRH
ncbi:MAG: phosphoglycerate kinase [Candidatus Saccharibacteria bacterium]